MTGAFEESALRERLDGLTTDQRADVACACAERLLPLYAAFVDSSRVGDLSAVRAALDLAWRVRSDVSTTVEIVEAQAAVEALVPDDDDANWTAWSPLAQNAAAAVAYALRCVRFSQSQDAVWGARQLTEAADYLDHFGPLHQYSGRGAAGSIAVAGIQAAITSAAANESTALRLDAEAEGIALRALARAKFAD